MFDELDVSAWAFVRREQLGTKEKIWLQDPETDVYWLLKLRTENRHADGRVFAKGDDWAERIASEIARALRVPAADTELAVRDDAGRLIHGVLSRAVVQADEETLLGNTLLADVDVHLAGPRDRSGYTLEAVQRALTDLAPPSGIDGLTAREVFVGHLVLDAIIGNTDRHPENWAAILRAGDRRLAATFDHASSLGFLLDDDKRAQRLATRDRNFTVEAFADRARSELQDQPHPVDAAVEGLGMVRPEARELWLDRCRDVDRLVEPIHRVPDHRMSATSKAFAERLVRRNWYRLMSHRFGTVTP